ncbi:MFS general substrate transporter [Annulohypoxylon bovei var. microspora]|nr:MFS general substrate transporter [Annulohypoxylon bovei var. microspora]
MASSSHPSPYPYFAPRYVIASVAVSLGGLLNGYDTGSIGAITHMPQFTESIGPLSSTMLGITVSMIMLTGTLPSVFAGHFADRFGRTQVIIPGALLFGIGALVQGLSHNLSQFIAGRAIAGFGQGVFLSNISVYICEIAPLRYRGTLAGLPQFMATAGVCSGYFTCYGTLNIKSDMAWRIPYILQCIFSAILSWACLLLPDSPRWLMLKGRQADALRALERLDFNMIEAERDFLTSTEQTPSLSPWQSFSLLFRRGYRARTILALFILGMVQLSGIDAITYYAPILFEQAGLSSANASFLASGLSSILMLAISIPAFLLADKWGRRTSAIYGGLALATVAVLAAYMPETRGRSLENIQEAFHRPAALSSLVQLLRPRGLAPTPRRRAHQTHARELAAGEEVELESHDEMGAVAASAVSVETVPRSMRLEVLV